ncbi:MAG TPA: methyltransferase, partial [Rhodospirillaceae bacterium]|nr:methyltransferase [Rhodospirillaceae bacterium]
MARNHPVVRRLTSLITDFGPISVEDFIAISLGDPEGGYYATQDPFGAAGDFTTSPEISQMFGEMIGAWCADSWERLGAPEPFALIELGPGRGTLMADALRALNTVPACRAAARIHMVETSPTLRASQQSAIADTDATWHLTIPEPSGMPAIFIANEFFDALPIRQFVKSEGRWRERRVDIDSETGLFKFTLGKSSPQSRHADHLITEALDGDILEESDAVRSIVDTIAEYIAAVGGAAIFIDYGHPYSAVGETLQAF